jgi:hypothetical protein
MVSDSPSKSYTLIIENVSTEGMYRLTKTLTLPQSPILSLEQSELDT